MKILMVTSEAMPLVKSGGLAESVSSLSIALSERGHDVRMVLPRYYFIDRRLLRSRPAKSTLETGLGMKQVRFHLPRERLPFRLALPECEGYFAHRHLYGDVYEPLGRDNGARYGLLSLAALAWCRSVGWRPDIVHCHDWPTAPTAALVRHRREPRREHPASVLTIHNCGYQGIFASEQAAILGLSSKELDDFGFSVDGSVNYLRAGIRSADWITTVSPRYAEEILTHQFAGALHCDLQERRDELTGILNGMDYHTWNPNDDAFLPHAYDEDRLEVRAEIKHSLQQEVGLEQNIALPLIGMITRLTEQKGISELVDPETGCLERMAGDFEAQFLILGKGNRAFERRLAAITRQRSNVAFLGRFDEGLAHRIEAASDFFLMPSQYEPCGLNQMYSLRYGAIPIVSATGGLLDTIEPYETDPDRGDGFRIDHPTPEGIYATVQRALMTARERPAHIRAIRQRGMRKRFRWDDAASSYESVYRKAKEASQTYRNRN